MTNVGWTEVRWRVPAEEAEERSDELASAVGGSVAFELDGEAAVLVAAVEAADDTPGWRTEIAARLGGPASPENLAFTPLADQDWSNAWRDVWRPFRVPPFAVVPHHFEGSLRANDVRVLLEPGAAFGTGRHQTTRACLAAVGRAALDGARVLDAGYGTGLLAVAAALRGASKVEGFDVDRAAHTAATTLAADNGVADRCRFQVGGFETLGELSGPYDLVLANIYHDVVEAHAGDLASVLAGDGTLVVSGCRRERREHVRAALERAGLDVADEVGVRWRTFTARRAR